MKKLFLTILIAAFLGPVTNLQAQAPKKITYQGKLTDSGGNPVSDGTYNIKFSLYDAVNAGSSSWEETQGVAVNDGLFNVYLGDINPININFNKAYWLGVKVGSDAEMTPRTPLSSAPYSLYAISIADNSVTASKIPNNSIDLNKIKKGNNGEILKTEGGNVTWSAPQSGARMFQHEVTGDNVDGQLSYLDHPDLNNNPDALVVANHEWNGAYLTATGVWYSTSRGLWTIYMEDLSNMPEGVKFNVVYQVP